MSLPETHENRLKRLRLRSWRRGMKEMDLILGRFADRELAAMGEGLSNAQIGLRLHVSPKTVDHHVSAILAKLEAPTRVEATRIARAEDLLPQNRELVAAK